MVAFRLVGGEGDSGYQPPVWTLPQCPRWIASVVTHTYSQTHTRAHCGVNRHMLFFWAADSFIMCLSIEELLFIVSPPAYSSGASLSHTSLYLSHYFPLCLSAPLHLSPLLSLYLWYSSLPLSHPLYITSYWENKEDIASYLVCVYLPACVFEMYEVWC